MIAKRLERFISEGALPGAALIVAVDRAAVQEIYCGHAAPGVTAHAGTVWPLACISKLYTAATILRLVELGELTLSMPVRSLLPSFVDDGRDDIRLRHLLTHTSGLARATPERMRHLLAARACLEELTADAYSFPLLFPPGTGFAYTDHGHVLAAGMATAATGLPFPALVHDLVLRPLGLRETYLPQPEGVFGRMAHIHGVPAPEQFNSPYWRGLGHPSLGVAATVSDLLHFGLRLTSGELLSRPSVRLMTTDQTGGDAPGQVMPIYAARHRPWGMGFSVRGVLGNGFEDMASPSAYDHLGAGGAILLIDPDASLALAFASNLHVDADRDGFVRRISTVVGMSLATWT